MRNLLLTSANMAAMTSHVTEESFPRECKDKDVAAMLDDITKEAKKKYFVKVLQHGGDEVTCNRRIIP
jgi:hypothetical protein